MTLLGCSFPQPELLRYRPKCKALFPGGLILVNLAAKRHGAVAQRPLRRFSRRPTITELGCRCLGFRDGRFCQCSDTIDRLSRIEAALAGKALPVPSGEVIASAFAGD